MIRLLKFSLLICLVWESFGILAEAQQQPADGLEGIPPTCSDQLKLIYPGGDAQQVAPVPAQLNPFVNVPVSLRCFLQISAKRGLVFNRKLVLASTNRIQVHSNTKQLSAPSGTAGTTSQISKPASPFSVISEYGGVTESTSNTTITVNLDPSKPIDKLNDSGNIVYCSSSLSITRGCLGNGWYTLLHGASFGLTFNAGTSTKNINANASPTGTTSGNSVQAVTATSSGSSTPSFAAFSFKYVALRSPAKKSLSLQDFQGIDFHSVSVKSTKLDQDLHRYKPYLEWQNCVFTQMNRSLTTKEAGDIFRTDYQTIGDVLLKGQPFHCSANVGLTPDLPNPASPAEIVADLNDFVFQSDVFESQMESVILNALSVPMLTGEYDLNTPQNQPANSTVKGIFTWVWARKHQNIPSNQVSGPSGMANGTPASTSTTLTINTGASFYNSTPSSAIPGANTLRDIQAGAEVDQNIPSSHGPKWINWIGDTTASATYYFQRQTSPSILKITPGSPLLGITFTGLPTSATQVFTQKGDIHLFQAKYGFGTGSNVKFPIAVTWSNRTELIAHPTWGLQFGVSYDFSSLLSSGSSSKTSQ